MFVRLLTSAADLAAYDQWVKTHPQGSLWQSLEWKKYQESLGREVRVYGATSDQRLVTSALVVIDRTVGRLSAWDIPRGPLSPTTELIERMVSDAKKDRCISLYISPLEHLQAASYKLEASSRHEQPEATRIVDLTLSDEQLLAQMHQKGRYNINVAKKNGVVIERSEDVDAYYELAQKTGKRDAFGIPSKRQLRAFIDHLPGSFLLLAYLPHPVPPPSGEGGSRSETGGGSPIAGLIGVTWHNTGIYYYGASDYEHRALMAPYLLQWESMKLCKTSGCHRYDLLGIAPIGSGPEHEWSGISDFKSKFGGTIISYPPEQEITLRPMVKRLLSMKRKFIG